MSEPYICEIRLFGGNFAPAGWAFCWGQSMSIQQNSTLFSLLGVNYGGDGVNTFNLPDLRGRFPLGWGTNPQTQVAYPIGGAVGQEAVTLTTAQLPMHGHTVQAGGASTTASAAGAYPAAWADNPYSTDQTAPAAMSPAEVLPTGGSQPHENRQPYLGLSFIISLYGVYPSRG
ncbi:tail fiber protein [Leifsonia sp. F6_8S_P_1B]|uniref:Tail fiber protein n=1 Tax=Leifsonia williamsii TaxID=3035919 RepID=A0ABT8K7V6_9MICO|nr:tail fiber protein [Leifsonia williamsii]MDN4613102.1 tail fiber protein [Leifsonia williamsii]